MKWGRFAFVIVLLAAALPASAKIVINEVAWMGTELSAQDEWIELYSDGGPDVVAGVNWNLGGWTLVTADGGTKINLKSSSSTSDYYLIERTNDESVPGVTADLVTPFGKGLSNDGEILILKDAQGSEVDRADGSGAWAIGGDAESRQTLQRVRGPDGSVGVNWTTGTPTPNAQNVVPKPRPTPASSTKTTQRSAEEKKSKAYTASALKPENGQSNGEFKWLLGGVLGGALLGVILVLWPKSR